MIPMVATTDEFRQVKAMVAREREHLAKHGHTAPRDVKLGAMLEVPSLLFDLDALLKEVSFVSVGSNDLMQFLFAVDRDNRRVANRFDTLSPALLRALGMVAGKAGAAGVPATVCGEMAGRPLEAAALLALGFRALSMTPASIGPVKATLLALDAREAAAQMERLMQSCDGCGSLRDNWRRWLEDRGVPC
jgi:phosphotransferase system enzyme I (PtsP)